MIISLYYLPIILITYYTLPISIPVSIPYDILTYPLPVTYDTILNITYLSYLRGPLVTLTIYPPYTIYFSYPYHRTYLYYY